MHRLLSFIKANSKPLIVLYLTWGIYFLIFWPKMLYFNEQGDLVAGWRNIWGDWAMHITLASAFTYQPILEVLQNHPLYAGIPLSYPFAINLISGLLMRFGFSLIQAFILPSIIFSFILLFGLYVFGKILTGSARQTLIAITIFMTSGGIGFYHYFLDLRNKFSWERVFYPPQEYTHMKDIGYYWTTTLLAHLVPQRAFLLGMTIGIFILSYLLYCYKTDFQKTTNKRMLLLGLVTGLLSYIHNHTLIVLFIVCAWLYFWSLKYYQRWASFAIGTALTAIPFFVLLSGPNFRDYFHFLPGWLANPKELNMSVFTFWFMNWGFLIPAFIAGFILTHSQKREKIFLSGFIVVFLLTNLFVFQPSSWDNAKLLLWVYLAFSFPAAGFLLYLWHHKFIGKVISILLFIVLIASGGIDLERVLHTSKQSFVMVSKEDIDAGVYLRDHTNYNDVILTSDEHIHWVPLISGRRILMGYRGWLWSYGIDYSQREKDIRLIYQGGQNAKNLIDTYKISYVVTDNNTKKDFGSKEEFFQSNYPLFISSPEFKVYKINRNSE